MAKDVFSVLLLLNATPQWLSLTRKERSDYFEQTLAPVFGKFEETIKVRMFDSEYFHARVSDFLFIETDNLYDYRLLIEMLRDTGVYNVPYFEVVDIIPAKENGFRQFADVLQ